MNKLDREFGSGFKVRQIDNYFRIGNKHVFLSCNKNTLHMLDMLKSHHDSKIHIFIGNDIDLCNTIYDVLSTFIMHSHSSIKLYIHFPYELKDLYMEFLKKCKLEPNKRLMILCERKFPTFKSFHELSIKYESNKIIAYINLFEIPCMEKNINSPIQDRVQLEDPESHKDEIIGRFKATTPLSILKSFKDENDIWDFIKVENEWAAPSKNNIHKKVDIITTEKDINKVKENVTEMIKQTVATIMEETNKEGE